MFSRRGEVLVKRGFAFLFLLLLLKNGDSALFFRTPSFCGVAFAETAGVSLEADAVLSAAESAFQAMKTRNYAELWGKLSRKSREAIVGNVMKAARKAGAGVEKGEVVRDFAEGGLFARAYWESYLTAFDPDAVLEHSRWDLGPIGKREAEILLKYEKAEQPARLKLFREDGLWRVGLEETFSGRRFLMQ